MSFETLEPVFARSPSNLFRRCVVNCPAKTPECQPCAEGQICNLVARSCDACAHTICEPSGPQTNEPESSGSPTGAIAGGVIGGLALIAAVVIVWWFCTRKSRKDVEDWDHESEKASDNFLDDRQGRQSTAASIASTVLTRASNVIQIAYIPGITNRSPDSQHGMIPPVPPIPIMRTNQPQEQHYFMPGDIRDSVWSSMTEDDRKSISPSLCARSSVATTIYRSNAIVSPVPAQQALRAKANVVSVKSGVSTPADAPGTPAVPSITDSHLNKANAVAAKLNTASPKIGMSSIVARSGVARPINLTKGSKTKNKNTTATTISEGSESSNTPKVVVESPGTSVDGDSMTCRSEVPSPSECGTSPDGDKTPRVNLRRLSSKNAMIRESIQSNAITEIDDSPAIKQYPFPVSTKDATSTKSSASLESLAHPTSTPQRTSQTPHRLFEAASKHQRTTSEESDDKRSRSPFDDKHEIKP
ncbi:hypothetical protein FQN57_001581 [Myotisia sp. PD_48]|nr:hypothetical protein FQN57_001581 [Myotisia sp. PD_48]